MSHSRRYGLFQKAELEARDHNLHCSHQMNLHTQKYRTFRRTQILSLDPKPPLLEWIFDVFDLAFSVAYLAVGTGYPIQAGRNPVVASFMAATLSSYRLVNELGVWLRLRSQAKTQPPPSRMDLEDFGISPPADGATSADGGSVALMVRMERDQAIKREDRKWQNARELLALL